MAEVTQMLRRGAGVISFHVAFPEAFADWRNPTIEELNNDELVIDITCIDEDGTTFTLGDSDTDDRYSFCDESGIDRPTFYNPEVTLAIYRDADRAAVSSWNQALQLFMFPDIEYFIIQRIGDQDKTLGSDFVDGDRISMQNIKTDYIAETLASEDPVMFEVTGLQQGRVLWMRELV